MKWASLFLAAGMTLRLFSDVTLPGIFSDHAVLARLPGTPVFGKADPGEAVSVEFAGQRIETKADAHGNWRVHFDLRKTGEGPHVITVIGKNVVTSNDVLVGEVWLCSGQSNMAFPLKDAESGKSVIESSADPKLRTFCVPFRAESAPVDHVNAVWQIAGPAGSGSFSAVAGTDGRFFWADAKIEEDTVVVSSGEVPFPVKVRYARQSNPTCNLYNKAGFPAVPFEK